MIKKIPLPFSGVILALFALVNLLKSYDLLYYKSLSFLGVFLVILWILALIQNIKEFKEQLKHPVVSSVLPTFTMALMLMSVFLKAYFNTEILWYLAIFLHVLLIINYIIKVVLDRKMAKIFPSIFIVFVGIVVASVTSPAFSKPIGQIAFYFGLISYGFLLPLVFYRLIKIKSMPNGAKPTIAIIAAPASLCLAGYLSAFETPSKTIVWFLLFIALSMTLYVLLKMSKLLKLPFSPGYAAYTFPFVISAIAVKKTSMFLSVNWLKPIVQIETIIATIMVFYVLIRYSLYFLKNNQQKQQKAA